MKILAACFILLTYSSFAQTDSTIYFRDFGWTIHLPSDFKVVDTASVSSLKNATANTIKESTGRNVNKAESIELIIAKKGKLNYFISNYINSSRFTAENWNRTDDSSRQLIFATLQKKVPIPMDTASSIVNIDGVPFKLTEAIFKNSSISLNFSYLTTFYKNHFLTINYMFTDSTSGKEILNMLHRSKFDKN